MSASTRWTIAIVAMVAVLGGVLVAQLPDLSSPTVPTGSPTADREHRDADTAAALAGPRHRAGLPPCPAPGPVTAHSVLDGVTVQCAADGALVDVGRALAGRQTVVNLWAYWCAECTAELPAMAEYQRRVGPDVTVVTVHQDENETAALLRLAQLGVRLPTLQDGRRLIAAALRVPNVMPVTVVLRPDGSVAQVLARTFASADEITAAVGDQAR